MSELQAEIKSLIRSRRTLQNPQGLLENTITWFSVDTVGSY